MDRVALLNGAPAVDVSAARTLGLTCFDTLALMSGRAIVPERHLDRLKASAATLALEPLGGWDSVDRHIEAGLGLWGARDGVLRVSLHARGEARGLHVEPAPSDVLVVVGPRRYPEISLGVKVVLSAVRAPDPATWPHHVKAPCLPRLLAHREAQTVGAFEALLLDGAGNVVSGSRSNLFVARNEILATPPSPPAFPGITRERLLASFAMRGSRVEVRAVHRDELSRADEAFLTFTGPGVVPVISVGAAKVGNGQPGPLTRIAAAVR